METATNLLYTITNKPVHDTVLAGAQCNVLHTTAHGRSKHTSTVLPGVGKDFTRRQQYLCYKQYITQFWQGHSATYSTLLHTEEVSTPRLSCRALVRTSQGVSSTCVTSNTSHIGPRCLHCQWVSSAYLLHKQTERLFDRKTMRRKVMCLLVTGLT
jgi:hypothetical protein